MEAESQNLTVKRNLKLGIFHIGSGMADVLTTGVWNRIMISDLGFAATPVGLLLSLRYFLSPLGIWAGRMSDEKTFLGFRRLTWIWLGRLMMVISTVLLGVSTAQLARDAGESEALQWVIIIISMLLFSVGTAISGTNFLALIYDRAGPGQRGRAVGIVWSFLLLGFTIGGVVFGLLLPEHEEGETALSFSPDALLTLFLIAAGIFAAVWFFSVLGEERRGAQVVSKAAEAEGSTSIRKDLSQVWRVPAMRFFLIYLTASMFFAFSQDLILEPFAGDVFNMPASVTNRFSAYWGVTAIAMSFLSVWLIRRSPRFNNTNLSLWGSGVLLVAFFGFAVSAYLDIRQLVAPGLLVLGVGLGLWNIGTLGLMMDLSPTGRAGTFLGFWTMAVTLARGAGVASGGIVRDLALLLSGDQAFSYGIVFVIGVFGLGFSIWALLRVNVRAYQLSEEERRAKTEAVLAGAMD